VRRGEATSPTDLVAITGATVSCRAAVATVNRARDRVFRDLMGMEPAGPPAARAGMELGTTEILTVALFLLAIPVFLRAGRWMRLAFLAAVVAVLGVYANQQLSAGRVFDLLALALPPPGNTAHFLLVLGALGLALLFGQVYCGLLCPFGAAQELLGRLGLARRPSPAADRRARFVKHVVLALSATAFLLLGPERVLAFDPLAVAFSGKAGGTMWLLIAIVGIASLFLIRFWCRYLCPVGAFLSFANRIAIGRGLARKKVYRRCDLGVRGRRDLDCIQCNRCITGEAS
jgi:polyferredoxin